ncbi:DeoR/GlpR family DNA-binding transcription regulator [Lactobacillus sp. UCMA15818]|uniref:DeoR/GlpR family DNA-binding transcription regulator n=1 Tax=Lactobacillaceae TaxID=33958 RepID=UPI0025B278E4|nr:DeoR/GlpR family DNA-binding transcription regulator [Lactobacillus sp. UCMA15818]MDN2454196.1 DeoR/GlpR transcriptional regulator [Lactobacillus sp. UCMA15818]
MLKQDRQRIIMALLNSSNTSSMTTVDIAKQVKVAPMTIRRDLKELSDIGLLTRIYGGASLIVEKTTTEKRELQKSAKREIGYEIARLVKPKMTIYLGAGTTVFASLDFLPKNEMVQYITNSDLAFHYLVNKDMDVVLTGGAYHKTTNEFVGTIAENSLSNYVFDIAFISTNGIWENSATTSHFSEGNVQKAAISRSKHVYVVCDHTKFGKADRFSFLSLNDATGIITDSGIPTADLKYYSQFSNIIVRKKRKK